MFAQLFVQAVYHGYRTLACVTFLMNSLLRQQCINTRLTSLHLNLHPSWGSDLAAWVLQLVEQR